MSPTPTEINPALPFVACPVPTKIRPDDPLEVVPEEKNKAPLTPSVPAFLLCNW